MGLPFVMDGKKDHRHVPQARRPEFPHHRDAFESPFGEGDIGQQGGRWFGREGSGQLGGGSEPANPVAEGFELDG